MAVHNAVTRYFQHVPTPLLTRPKCRLITRHRVTVLIGIKMKDHLIRRTNTGNATFDHEGNTANEPWRKTDHRRTIDFGLWQAGLLRYVGQDPQPSTWEWCARRGMGSKGSRAVGDATPPGHAAAVSRGQPRSPNHEDRARECQIISAPPRGCWSGRRQEAINLGLPALAYSSQNRDSALHLAVT